MSNADVYFFSAEQFSVSMSADINAAGLTPPTLSAYDYVLTLDTNLNNLFNTKTYVEAGSIDQATISLVLNSTAFNSAMSSARMHSYSEVVAPMSGLIAGASTIDNRYMEMIALKLFGNAKARAAIQNDVSLLANAVGEASLTASLLNHVTTLVEETGKEDIFQAYFSSNRPDAGDSVNDQNYSNFNFTGQTLSFPAWINGTIDGEDVESSILNRSAATYGGYSDVTNGIYAIKVLIRVGDQDGGESGVSA